MGDRLLAALRSACRRDHEARELDKPRGHIAMRAICYCGYEHRCGSPACEALYQVINAPPPDVWRLMLVKSACAPETSSIETQYYGDHGHAFSDARKFVDGAVTTNSFPADAPDPALPFRFTAVEEAAQVDVYLTKLNVL